MPKILVVEDININREVLSRRLELPNSSFQGLSHSGSEQPASSTPKTTHSLKMTHR
jgi:hypothetical protein